MISKSELKEGLKIKDDGYHDYHYIYDFSAMDDEKATIHLNRIHEIYKLMSSKGIFPPIESIHFDIKAKYLSIKIDNIYSHLALYDMGGDVFGYYPDIEITLELETKICDKIINMHSLGYGHGDLTPECIFYDADENVYITDFTYAYHIESQSDFVLKWAKDQGDTYEEFVDYDIHMWIYHIGEEPRY